MASVLRVFQGKSCKRLLRRLCCRLLRGFSDTSLLGLKTSPMGSCVESPIKLCIYQLGYHEKWPFGTYVCRQDHLRMLILVLLGKSCERLAPKLGVLLGKSCKRSAPKLGSIMTKEVAMHLFMRALTSK